MGVDIGVKPEDSWAFFTQHKERLANKQIEIARNADTKTSVCITEENGLPVFNVYRNNAKRYSEPAVESDCRATLRDIYINHLFPIVVCDRSKEENGGKDNKSEQQDNNQIACDLWETGPSETEDEMEEREDELRMAVYDALSVFFLETPEVILGAKGLMDVLSDMVDDVCIGLAQNYGISVYRPVWKESDDGVDMVLDEFPYDSMAEGDDIEGAAAPVPK